MKTSSTVLKGGHVAVLDSATLGGMITIFEEDTVTLKGAYRPAKCISEINAVGLQKYLNGLLPEGTPITEELYRLRNIVQGIRDYFNQPMGDPFPSATDLLSWLESTTGFELKPAEQSNTPSKEESSHVQD